MEEQQSVEFQELTIDEQLELVRDVLSVHIMAIEEVVANRPEFGADITKGLNKLKEARMWFGVAQAQGRGLNPWTNKMASAKEE